MGWGRDEVDVLRFLGKLLEKDPERELATVERSAL